MTVGASVMQLALLVGAPYCTQHKSAVYMVPYQHELVHLESGVIMFLPSSATSSGTSARWRRSHRSYGSLLCPADHRLWSILAHIPRSATLLCAQNAAAWPIMDLRMRDQVHQLYDKKRWLPMDFKLCTTMLLIPIGQCSLYSSAIVSLFRIIATNFTRSVLFFADTVALNIGSRYYNGCCCTSDYTHGPFSLLHFKNYYRVLKLKKNLRKKVFFPMTLCCTSK